MNKPLLVEKVRYKKTILSNDLTRVPKIWAPVLTVTGSSLYLKCQTIKGVI